MTLTELKRRLTAGTRLTVTNHYITREDHPCFGTREAEVARQSGSALYLSHPDPGRESSIYWPKASQVVENADGTVTILGGGAGQAPDDPFMTIRWEA